jgi:hypothetical protein
MTRLLDVSALISLLDANHTHHTAVMGWFGQNKDGWASCPITQNGYLRIVTQDKYPNTISVEKAISTLEQAVSGPGHKFLHDDISLLDQQLVAHQHVQGHKQLTDIYLLALSVHHGAQFVTLDEGVPRVAVRRATNASVHVIGR